MARSKDKKKAARERAKRRAQETTADSGFGYIKPEGDVEKFEPSKRCTIAIVPFERATDGDGADAGDLDDSLAFSIHRNIGAEKETVVCPKSVGHKRCPVCEDRARLRDDEDVDEDVVKSLHPQKRHLYNVLTEEGEVELYNVADGNFAKVMADELLAEDDETYYGHFLPDEGCDLVCKFSKESFAGNDYWECRSIEFKVRDEPLDDEVLEEAQVLDAILEVKSYDELKALYFEEMDDDDYDPDTEEDDDDDDDEEKPKRKKRSSKKSSSKKKRKNSKKEQECPAGAEFGVDAGDLEDCETCELWEECAEKSGVAVEEDDEEPEKAYNELPDGCIECVACEGTGKNSKGRRCRPCRGNGYIVDPDAEDPEDDDDDDDEEKPKRKKRSSKKKGARRSKRRSRRRK